jgi:hypothetical protein
MRRLNHRSLARQAREAIGELTWLEAHATLIADRANNDVDDTLTANPTGNHGRLELTHPERHAGRRLTTGADPVAAAMADLLAALNTTVTSAQAARTAASRLITDPDSHGAIRALAQAKDKAGAGHCLNCDEYVPGIKDDRLRAGECYACYRYRRDHHGNPRPAELYAEEVSS